MYDKQVHVESIVAVVLWVAGGALVMTTLLEQIVGCGTAGVSLIIAGCMVDLHGMFADLKRREVKAFELGRRLTSISEIEQRR